MSETTRDITTGISTTLAALALGFLAAAAMPGDKSTRHTCLIIGLLSLAATGLTELLYYSISKSQCCQQNNYSPA